MPFDPTRSRFPTWILLAAAASQKVEGTAASLAAYSGVGTSFRTSPLHAASTSTTRQAQTSFVMYRPCAVSIEHTYVMRELR